MRQIASAASEATTSTVGAKARCSHCRNSASEAELDPMGSGSADGRAAGRGAKMAAPRKATTSPRRVQAPDRVAGHGAIRAAATS